MGWFKMAILVWLILALIRFIGGSIIDPEWSSSNNVFELLRSTWGFTMILKPLMGTIYQASVVTLTLAFVQHCGMLAVTHVPDICTIAICTALAPLVIPYVVYGEITLTQYLTALDESLGFALIATLFYAVADFFQTLTVRETPDPVAATPPNTTGTVARSRGSGDRLIGEVIRRSAPVQPKEPMSHADKLREFTFYTFLVSLPLVLFWEVCLG